MANLTRFFERWSWALVALIVWALAVVYGVGTARGPYAGLILCPKDLPNCHDVGAPWPIEPWAVAAGFLAVVVVAVVSRWLLDRRG
jgi:hypothetical protein